MKAKNNNQTMVTTNIRLPKSDWLQTKAIAAGLGMSLNQYATTVIISANKNKALIQSQDEEDVIWQLADIGPEPINNAQEDCILSEEDQAIYEQ
jgi:hypothetical protein